MERILKNTYHTQYAQLQLKSAAAVTMCDLQISVATSKFKPVYMKRASNIYVNPLAGDSQQEAVRSVAVREVHDRRRECGSVGHQHHPQGGAENHGAGVGRSEERC